MIEKTVKIKSPSGLHARSAAQFVKYSNEFESDIEIEYKGNKVNGKSIIGIMTLGAFEGEEVKIIAKGIDEKKAVEKLVEVINKEIR